MEYVLILIIVVGIILALSREFMPSLKGYVEVLTGNYVECLLERGELPGLGGESNSTSGQDSCEAVLGAVKGNLSASSKAFKSATGGDGASGAGGSKDSSDSAGGKNSGDKNAKNKSDSDKAGGGGGGSVSVNGRSANLNTTRGSRSIESGPAEEEKVTLIQQGKGSGFMRTRTSTVAGISSGGRYISGQIELTDAQQRQVAARTEAPPQALAVAGGEELPRPVKKMFVKPPPPKEKPQTDDEPMSFGNYLRYIFIAAIIIVIIAVIGGQAASTSKGWDS